ncbi:MAG TPA: hypothetical protein VL981_03970 [Candidatus Methylacidiphilales bacterium]|nr:hypothetical protein [Candidatus Methylacidiphilales bacterium]
MSQVNPASDAAKMVMSVEPSSGSSKLIDCAAGFTGATGVGTVDIGAAVLAERPGLTADVTVCGFAAMAAAAPAAAGAIAAAMPAPGLAAGRAAPRAPGLAPPPAVPGMLGLTVIRAVSLGGWVLGWALITEIPDFLLASGDSDMIVVADGFGGAAVGVRGSTGRVVAAEGTGLTGLGTTEAGACGVTAPGMTGLIGLTVGVADMGGFVTGGAVGVTGITGTTGVMGAAGVTGTTGLTTGGAPVTAGDVAGFTAVGGGITGITLGVAAAATAAAATGMAWVRRGGTMADVLGFGAGAAVTGTVGFEPSGGVVTDGGMVRGGGETTAVFFNAASGTGDAGGPFFSGAKGGGTTTAVLFRAASDGGGTGGSFLIGTEGVGGGTATLLSGFIGGGATCAIFAGIGGAVGGTAAAVGADSVLTGSVLTGG